MLSDRSSALLRQHFWRIIAFLAVFALGTHPGWAEDPPADNDDLEGQQATPVATERDVVLVEGELPFIPTTNTITTKLPVELDWTPANVGIVNGALVEEQNGQILGDALQNVSGVNVQTGQGVFDFFTVRGFDSLSSALVLTDGAPEPEATFYQMYNTERVEMFKGPAGFLYGPNPLAGAVNIVRKQPAASDFGALTLGWQFFDLAGHTGPQPGLERRRPLLSTRWTLPGDRRVPRRAHRQGRRSQPFIHLAPQRQNETQHQLRGAVSGLCT